MVLEQYERILRKTKASNNPAQKRVNKYNSGKWQEDEVQRLVSAMKKFDVKVPWCQVSALVKTRDPNQCLKRFRNVDKPMKEKDELEKEKGEQILSTNKKGKFGRPTNALPWTEEDDQKLLELIKIHGVGKWSKISDNFKGRNNNHIHTRFLQLNPQSKAPKRNKKEHSEAIDDDVL